MDDNFSTSIWTSPNTASPHAMPITQQGQRPIQTSGTEGVREADARRNIYSKEQWQALKPVIERLYVTEGQTFIKVVEYLREHHGVKPTKKQFLRRISEWGFQKNVKRGERRAILEGLGRAVTEGGFEARILRGRKLDKAKIERWKKREGFTSEGTEAGSARHPEVSGGPLNLRESGFLSSGEAETCTHDNIVEELPRHEPQSTSTNRNQGQMFNPWLCVDVTGSPELTGLIGALTLELSDDIPDFNLIAPYSEEFGDEGELRGTDGASGVIVSTHTYNTRQLFGGGLQPASVNNAIVSSYLSGWSQYRMPGPLDELYPFPQVAPRKKIFYGPNTDHLASSYSLSVKELECKRKFKALKSMERPDIIRLVEDMRSVAWRHFELDHFHLAEAWWRRVVKSSLEITEHEPLHILEACLWVVINIRRQSRFAEARSLHKDLHSKILNLCRSNPAHELAIRSRKLSAGLLMATGDHQSEATFRELLQLCLVSFGTRDIDTILLLSDLGTTLLYCGQFQQAEIILKIRLQLDRGSLNYSKRNIIKVQNHLKATDKLARCLTLQQRFEDSANVLNSVEPCFQECIRTYGYVSPSHYCEKARLLKFQGRLAEYEDILRTSLIHVPDRPYWYRLQAMEWLADLLTETDRKKESVVWRQRVFLMSTDMYGFEDIFSRFCGEKLGFCYVEVGRYEDAIVHFQQTAGKLALSKTGEPDSLNEYIEKIRRWISAIEKMKEGARAEEIQQISRDFPQKLSWDGYELNSFETRYGRSLR
ncbi:hypothetical protein V8E51_015454 [Hyaloscypha variabilis]